MRVALRVEASRHRRQRAAGGTSRPTGWFALAADRGRKIGTIEMVACETLFREFERGLSSRYFRDRILPAERALLGEMVRGIATVVRDPQSPPRVIRDPADDYLVAMARAAGVDAIVSADRDLLDHDGLDPPAVSARDACEALGLLGP